MIKNNKIKVLVIDDSIMARKILKDIINSDPSLEVIDMASNGKTALQKLKFVNPI